MAPNLINPEKPIRVRLLSPLGFYPKHSVVIPGARLIVREDLIISRVELAAPETHGLTDAHFYDLEFLTLEEIRFLAAIVLAVHPDDGMVYTYPLLEHVDVSVELHKDALLAAARAPAILEPDALNKGRVLPPCYGGPSYTWREPGVDARRVLKIASDTALSDHLLMRGLGSLLRSDMCWQHREIAEAAVMHLHIALDASFQIMLRLLRAHGIPNPTASDAGNLLDEIFNPEIASGAYFQDYYEARIKTAHTASRFGIFPTAPLDADDYYFLRHGLVEVYHWLVTEEKLTPERPTH